MQAIAQTALAVAGYLVIGALCLAAVLLSCLSISGTWLVTAAALLAALFREAPFPGVATVLLFAAVSLAVELVEFLAGAWGVRRSGGSAAAGAAAVAGGLVGLVAGSFIPVPILGSLLGMTAGGFLAAFLVELRRLRNRGAAARVAWGTVLARLAVILVKVGVTLGLTAYLVAGLIRSS